MPDAQHLFPRTSRWLSPRPIPPWRCNSSCLISIKPWTASRPSVLDQPQVLSGQVTLPANCSDAGYPVHFQFTGPTVIPGVPNSFAFDRRDTLERISRRRVSANRELCKSGVSTAVACAAPLISEDVVITDNAYLVKDLVAFDAPFVDGQPAPSPGDGGDEDAGGPQHTGGLSLDIAGQVRILVSDAGLLADAGLPPDAGLPIGATVRILALTDAGALSGSRLSGDQPLQFVDGGLWFGSTFVAGGPAALPVPPRRG